MGHQGSTVCNRAVFQCLFHFFGHPAIMIEVFYGFFIGETQYLYKVLPADPAPAFHGGCIGGISNIPDGYNTIRFHFLFCPDDFRINQFRGKAPFGYHGTEEINQSGMRGNNIFKVTEFKVTMGIDQTRTKNAGYVFSIFACFTFRYDRFHFPFFIGDQYFSFAESVAIKKTVSLEFSVSHAAKLPNPISNSQKIILVTFALLYI